MFLSPIHPFYCPPHPIAYPGDLIYLVHLHNGVLLNSKKYNGIIKLTGKWLEPEEIILSEVTQTQKEKNTVFTYS